MQKPLSSPIHFHTAATENKKLVVYLDNELIASGIIEEITERAVKVGGEYHFFTLCEFYIE